MTDFRALCVELTDCLEKADWPPRYQSVFQQWINIAPAALAEADGPAVSEDREPASVTLQLSDEEVRQWVTQCADLTRLGWTEHYWAFDVSDDHVCDIARAVHARWGRPAAAPVPVPGEVGA